MSVKNITYSSQHIHHHLQSLQYQSYNRQPYIQLFQDKQNQQILFKSKEQQPLIIETTLKTQDSHLEEQINLLKSKQSQLLTNLNKLAEQYGQIYKEYLILIEDQGQQIQDQYDRAQSNRYFLENQIEKLRKKCTEQNTQKQIILQKIKQYSLKRKALNQTLDQGSLALNKIIKNNTRKQEQIKIQRQIYQKLQEEIFNLDIQNQNLKKYGFQNIPIQLQNHIKEKQQFRQKINLLNDRIDHENKLINKMIKKQSYKKIQNQIQLFKQKTHQIQKLQEQNIVLIQQNKQLNDIKYICQWNPNLQINTLQENIKEQQNKITKLKKQNIYLNKKSHQIMKKIQSINRKRQMQAAIMNEGLKNEKKKQEIPVIKNKYLVNKDKESKSKLFNEIKHDLQLKNHVNSSLNSSLSTGNQQTKFCGIIWINTNEFNLKIKSKKLKILYMTVILMIFALLTCKR